ncbi:hypothetical protein NL676_005164 [Syzygium grande]|nr:hypothetical protein NL676_005164 [Syzygium grande]
MTRKGRHSGAAGSTPLQWRAAVQLVDVGATALLTGWSSGKRSQEAGLVPAMGLKDQAVMEQLRGDPTRAPQLQLLID